MDKKAFLILLIVLITPVYASDGADWLLAQGDDGIWGNIRESAFSIMALDKITGYDRIVANGTSHLADELETCIENNNCNMKDVAIAIWALNEVGGNIETVNSAGIWLKNARSVELGGEISGEWFIQVVSSSPRTCNLKNLETGESQDISVVLNADGYMDWVRVGDNMLVTKDLSLDCEGTETGLVLSVINKKVIEDVTNYFIIQEEPEETNITIELGGVCWGQNYRTGSCSKDVTGHVLFVLNEINNAGDPSWLIERKSGALDNLFLYMVTDGDSYLDSLEAMKNKEGYWESSTNVYTTAMIYALLKDSQETMMSNVEGWLNFRKSSNGCWPKNLCRVDHTGLVLYGGISDEVIPEEDCDVLDGDEDCDGDGLRNAIDNDPLDPDTNNNDRLDGDDDFDGDGTPNKRDRDIDNDGVLNEDDEDPWDDRVGKIDDPDDDDGDVIVTGDRCRTTEGCEGEYNVYGECIDIRGDECPRDDVPDDGSGTTSRPPRPAGSTPPDDEGDDETEGSSVVLWILLVLLLLLILIGGGYLAYKKGLLKFDFINKPKPQAKYRPRLGPRPKQRYVPRMTARTRRKPELGKQMEHELDRSMKDLEKLLGGKKK